MQASNNPPERALDILLVDDDETELLLMRARLESEGYSVTARHQALGTTRAVLHDKPDIVVLDLRMPALSGEELAQILGKNGTAVILHSGEEGENKLKKLAEDAGALGYIVKSEGGTHFLPEFEKLAAQYRMEKA